MTNRAIPDDLTTRERCALCHRHSPVGFWVPDDVWAACVHPHWQNSIVCLWCFAHGADERGVRWELDIKLYPVSHATLRAHRRERPAEGPLAAAARAVAGWEDEGEPCWCGLGEGGHSRECWRLRDLVKGHIVQHRE